MFAAMQPTALQHIMTTVRHAVPLASQSAAAAAGIRAAGGASLRQAVLHATVATSPAGVVDASSAHAPAGLRALVRQQEGVNDESFRVNKVRCAVAGWLHAAIWTGFASSLMWRRCSVLNPPLPKAGPR